MYSTCLFCHRPLGANDLIEHFPVGRRLAFDAAKGRLWVICPSCQRWNLTPLEERWEAVEDLERRVRATHFRVSTDNIGLARLPGGLDAVRIGRPLRPEMAGWRYGRIISGRYWRYGVPTMMAIGIGLSGGGAYLTGLVSPLGAGAIYVLAFGVALAIGRLGGMSGDATVLDNDGIAMRLTHRQLLEARLVPNDTSLGWELRLESLGHVAALTGDPAVRASAVLLARLNWNGAKSANLTEAVRYLDIAGDPQLLIARIARIAVDKGLTAPFGLPKDIRLALEMATHDANERDALAGDLAALQVAWREAEAIAAIADNLLLQDAVREKFGNLREPR
jgi:hypothetical protein